MRDEVLLQSEINGNELRRLAALDEQELLDTEDEVEFDNLVQLAAQVCSTPMSTFTLVARERQWCKAAYGLRTREHPRSVSFCSHAIAQDDLMVVEDAREDDRFRGNVLVTGYPHIRFYAGMPLAGTEGAHLGTLCVLDTVPRQLTDSQRRALRVLGAQVTMRMDMRRQQRELQQSLAETNRLLRELAASEDRFKTYMTYAPLASFMKDAQGRFVFYNDRLAAEFGVTGDEWIGKTVHDLFPAEAAEKYRQSDLEAVRAGRVQARLEDTRSPTGEVKHWKSYKFPWVNAEGETMLGGVAVDVTQEVEQKQILERLATADALTGLANRRPLNDILEREFSLYRRTRNPLSVIMLDLDDFKQRNDLLGHAAGDEILKKLGRVLRDSTRISDLPGRYGGEEFLVVLPATDWVGAARVAENIRRAMCDEVWPGGPVTASFGVATTGIRTRAAADLIAEADASMYMRKRARKDRLAAALLQTEPVLQEAASAA